MSHVRKLDAVNVLTIDWALYRARERKFTAAKVCASGTWRIVHYDMRGDSESA